LYTLPLRNVSFDDCVVFRPGRQDLGSEWKDVRADAGGVVHLYRPARPGGADDPRHAGWISAVAFSRDGKRLATGSWDSTVLCGT